MEQQSTSYQQQSTYQHKNVLLSSKKDKQRDQREQLENDLFDL